MDALDQVRVPSKSERPRFAYWLEKPQQMRSLHNGLLQAGLPQPPALPLEKPLELEDYFLDTTCVKANLHFPGDWGLLRDATRTLMKAVKRIREQGLKARMEPPEKFLRRINRWSIAMTHSRRKTDCQKERKRILRQMKKLVQVVGRHARRQREVLAQQWSQTDWTRKQAGQVLRRTDQVLALLPQAQKQAQERSLGERPVAHAGQLLSLDETAVRVVVRGKAGAEVEFGHTGWLGENRQGIIWDYQVWQEPAPAEVPWLVESLERVVVELDGKVSGVGADRGFASQANSAGLAAAEIFNGICPKRPPELKERMKEKRFVQMQKRRSQTEARRSIVPRGFWGRPRRAKGFAHRERSVAWGGLTPNLWRLARLKKPSDK